MAKNDRQRGGRLAAWKRTLQALEKLVSAAESLVVRVGLLIALSLFLAVYLGSHRPPGPLGGPGPGPFNFS
jgi:hypothetical protein